MLRSLTEGRAGVVVAGGSDEGGTHVLSCASACLCLGGMQSHMKEALSLTTSLSDSDLMSVSKGPLSPRRPTPFLTHTTCQQTNPQLQKHT